MVLSGRVKVFVADADGREMVLDFHGPGDYVGEMSLDGRPRPASVMAVEPTACSALTREALRAAIVAHPDLAMNLMCTLIERARTATENVHNPALMDVCGRLARLLLSLDVGQPGGKMAVPERLTQQAIAGRRRAGQGAPKAAA